MSEEDKFAMSPLEQISSLCPELQIAIKHTKNTFEQGEIRRQITQYENALKEQASF